MNNNPIAVIDSGVGGLASIAAVRDEMPEEDIIYFGDTAFMPYGTKSAEEICQRAKLMAEFLKSKNVKAILIACNTLSTVALQTLFECCPMALVQGMMEPVVATVSRNSAGGDKFGIIATPRTVESGVYQEAVKRIKKDITFEFKGLPELSVYIEKGITDGPEMQALLHGYLDEMVAGGITHLILGCTHYPLAKDCIEKMYPSLKVLNPIDQLASQTQRMIAFHDMANDDEHEGILSIYASELTSGFRAMAERLGYGDCEIAEVQL